MAPKCSCTVDSSGNVVAIVCSLSARVCVSVCEGFTSGGKNYMMIAIFPDGASMPRAFVWFHRSRAVSNVQQPHAVCAESLLARAGQALRAPLARSMHFKGN